MLGTNLHIKISNLKKKMFFQYFNNEAIRPINTRA